MTRYKNQREVDESFEDDLVSTDKEIEGKDKDTKDKDKEVDWQDRYSHLRRHQMEQKTSYETRLAQMQKQLEGFKNGTLKPPKSKEEIEEWRAQFPEFGDVLESWMSQVVEEKTQDLKKQSDDLKKEKAFIELKKLVPDAVDHLQPGSEFLRWLDDQSQLEYKTIHNSFDYKSAAAVLNRFKSETGLTKHRDEEDPRDAARSIRTRSETNVNTDSGGFLFSESQIEEETRKDPRWWDRNEDKILDAQRKNKILLDLSGAARR